MNLKKSNIILSIPLINVIADSIQGYFGQGYFSPGYLRTYIILTLSFLVKYNYDRRDKITKIILLSLLYYFLLVITSSDFLYTFSIYLKFLVAAIMFPIGYKYINNKLKYLVLLKILMYVLMVYTFVIIISTIFHLGTSGYEGAGGIYYGIGRVNITKPMALLVIISPLLLKYEGNKKKIRIYASVILLAAIFIVVGVKRTAVIGIPISLIIYYFLTPFKGKLLRSFFIISVIFAITSPFYLPLIEKNFAFRAEKGRFDVDSAQEEEGRIIEIFTVLDKFAEDNIVKKLFGEELFNSRVSLNTSRMLHTDYAIMFSGSGFIGFFMFLYVHWLITKKLFKYWRLRSSENKEIRNICAVGLSTMFFVLLVSFSGTVTAISIRSISYFFWGSTLGYLDSVSRKNKFKTIL